MAVQSKKVFISYDSFVAFIDRAHPKHSQAAAFFRYFAQENYQVFTSILSIEEAYSEIYEKISPSLAKDLLRALSLSSINILYPNESDFKAALKTLVNFRNTELSFKDAQMSVMAERNGIFQICTFGYLHPLFGITAFYLPI